jgi:hypothetical protein
MHDSTKSYLATPLSMRIVQQVTVTINKNKVKIMLDKLDEVKLELKA